MLNCRKLHMPLRVEEIRVCTALLLSRTVHWDVKFKLSQQECGLSDIYCIEASRVISRSTVSTWSKVARAESVVKTVSLQSI